MKRFLDIVVSFVAMLFFSPFGLIISVILKCTGEGEILYIHPRIGRNGKHFGLIKFATMLKDSPNLGTGDITVQNDPRVLPFGRFLRKTKINEVPQLINVLKGDMSLIGPRPLTPKNFDYYQEEVKEIICRMRPGLSGVGSIIFRDEETIMANSDMSHHEFYKKYIAPYKGELETWYQNNRSLCVDMKLILLTFWVIIYPQTRLPFRLFKSLPSQPTIIFDATDRKSTQALPRSIEVAPKIVEVEPMTRRESQRSTQR